VASSKSKDINDLNLDPLLLWVPGGGHEELGSSNPVEAVRGKGVVGHKTRDAPDMTKTP
jgi:hypothetical protein